MPLTLVTGPANAEKAREVLGRARELAAAGAEPMLVVPTADVSDDGRIVAVRSYRSLVVWLRHGREPLAQTLARAPTCTAPADLGVERQGEALALAPDGRSAITGSEGRDAPLRRFG